MSKLRVTMSRRVTALVDEEIEYEIDGDLYRQYLEEGMSSEDALEEIRANDTYEVCSYNTEVDEVLMVHDCEVTT